TIRLSGFCYPPVLVRGDAFAMDLPVHLEEEAMRRMLVFITILALALPMAARAQGKPDFSGTWTLDQSKSDPPPQRGGGGRGGFGGGGTQTIKQSGSELSVTTEGRGGQQ